MINVKKYNYLNEYFELINLHEVLKDIQLVNLFFLWLKFDLNLKFKENIFFLILFFQLILMVTTRYTLQFEVIKVYVLSCNNTNKRNVKNINTF